jgi:hypothetical protein
MKKRPENFLLMHVCKERIMRLLKIKEDKEMEAKKTKNKRPVMFWADKYHNFENKTLAWGGLYHDCSLHL